MNKKVAVLILTLMAATVSLYAKDVTEKSVGTENSWQESISLEGKSSGKYNIVVTATDTAGNTTQAGPFNIKIDPESDLPVASITNPAPDMIVPGNLNIVGTCVDDDGVDFVTIILDGDSENPVKAEGKEFWSYYLDTTQLIEGEHTVEVFGTDINGLPGKSTKVIWSLNRRAPTTDVKNQGMGVLLSGKINLEGYVKDGNGIKQLEYSLDGGQRYTKVKLKEQKLAYADEQGAKIYYHFSIPVDTRKFEDGPAVCWFKGTDKGGTVGYYTYLFFVDNTPPDIKIVSPEKNEAQNGVFIVAGYAKDINGMQSLSWQWGSATGSFDLVPGNPYWLLEINSIGLTKSQVFSVTGVDTMGNSVTVNHTINFDQQADKPVIDLVSPVEGLDVDGSEGSLYIRGIAKDDDGLAQIFYTIDDGEEIFFNAKGVFYHSYPKALQSGNHTVKVWGVDKYGVKGDPVVRTVSSQGVAPDFNNVVVKTGKESKKFVSGMEINPETNSTFEMEIASSVGLSEASYSISWGGQTQNYQMAVTNGQKTATITIPLSADDYPWGISILHVYAKDTIGRDSNYNAVINIKDLTKPHAAKPELRFLDSQIPENGKIIYRGNTVSGYLIGAVAKSVQVIPASSGAKATLSGNSVVLSADGATQPFTVRVTTDKGAVYNSKELQFIDIPTGPSINIDDNSINSGVAVDFSIQPTLKINGQISSEDGIAFAGYRFLTAEAKLKDGVVVESAVKPVVSLDKAEPIQLDERGNFTLNFAAEDFPDGITVVEIASTDKAGRTSAKAVIVNNVPVKRVATDESEVIPPSDAPRVYWLQGVDYYGVCVYQGNVDKLFTYYKNGDVRSDTKELKFVVTPTDVDNPQPSEGTLKVFKHGTMSGRFFLVDGETYASGKEVAIKKNATADDGHTIQAFIDSTAAVVSADWTLISEGSIGGEKVQKGKSNPVPVTEGSQYMVSIPLAKLPAGTLTVEMVVTDATGVKETVTGYLNVVRKHDVVNSDEGIYFYPGFNCTYNASTSTYNLFNGGELKAIVNTDGDFTPSFVRNTNGLEITTTEGSKIITIKSVADGSYSNVQVRAKNKAGASIDSPAVTIATKTEKPQITITSPEIMGWVGNQVAIKGKMLDGTSSSTLYYNMEEDKPSVSKEVTNEDGTVSTVTEKPEQQWIQIPVSRDGSFSTVIDITSHAEGYVPLNFRAVNASGQESVIHYVLQKDTVAPVVKVVLPDAGSKINGENLLVLDIEDAGYVSTIDYQSANGRIKKSFNRDLGDEAVDADSPEYTMTQALANVLIGNERLPLESGMKMEVKDLAGNSTSLEGVKWPFEIDQDSDKPVAEIHMPAENAVITTDFTISGIIYDDDSSCRLWYKIDNNEYRLLSEEYSSSYKIDIPLSAMTDNEHSVTVYAEDINGIKGNEVTRNFRISLEEPKGSVTSPKFDETVSGRIVIRGNSTDKNGISKVQISLDNGASYQDAEGTTDWSYEFDSRVIEDGTHVVFVKLWDGYGIPGLVSSLINIDNTSPDIILELPLDDSKTTDSVFFSGQTTDNIGLTDLTISIRSFDPSVRIPANMQTIKLTPDRIISQKVDISSLANGFYNLELTGTDAAGNITRVSRNIELDKNAPRTKVSIMYPLNGEHVQSRFNIFGEVISEDEISTVELYIDDVLVPGFYGTQITDSGYYKFAMKNELKQKAKTIKDEEGNVVESLEKESYILEDGKHTYKVVATTTDGKKIESITQSFIYNKYGPWVTLDNFTYGDFATDRPILKGNAGYVMNPEDAAALKNKNTPSEIMNNIQGMKVKQVYLSFDNGRTFTPVSKKGKTNWKYQVENLDLAEGFYYMLIKAEMENGETAITRNLVQIDHTNPTIKLISPGEGGHYNQSLEFDGLASDDVALKDITISLRKGDKASYEVPAFIQGLYFDVSVWGATLYNVGVGLTAFDNAVKIQANFGQFTKDQWNFVNDLLGMEHSNYRFGGNVIGAKIIAQIGYLPMRYLFGRNFDWLSATLSVGANFSYFSDSGAIDASGNSVAQVLSAALVQVEFPRITFADQKLFKTWSFYFEPQVWFIPSDVASESAKRFVFTYSFGLRTTVF